MNYRTRQQWMTGKLILQWHDIECGWLDVRETPAVTFEIIDSAELASLRARVAKSEKRAAGQRKAYAEKKAKQ